MLEQVHEVTAHSDPDRAVNGRRWVCAEANANVALAKYWGKRNEALNLPFGGSISITLAGLTTRARVAFDPQAAADHVTVNGVPVTGLYAQQLSAFLDLIRRRAALHTFARVELGSNFPIAAGLASSASTFAALAVAASQAAGLSSSTRELSVLARLGSGSAARSILGGYVEWLPGEKADGTDSYAVQLAPADHWSLGIVVAITTTVPKAVGSRLGMARSVRESPFFPAWLQLHDADLDSVRRGVLERDLTRLGRAAESNCLAMHAVALTARPPLLYWNAGTLAVMQRVIGLREEGIEAYFTIDAGPQVKVICALAQRQAVAEQLRQVAGVERIVLSAPGDGVRLREAV